MQEPPNEFRCVSVDLLTGRIVVHRRDPLSDGRLFPTGARPFAPIVYDGTMHVDGAVLDSLAVAALARTERC